MKNYIKALIMFLFLNYSILNLAMEAQENSDPKELHELGLPNEMWSEILWYIYAQPIFLGKVDDIYQGVHFIQTSLPEETQKLAKSISLTCRAFHELNHSFSSRKEEFKKFQAILLKKFFLKHLNNKEELYPNNDKKWLDDPILNQTIAKFLFNPESIYLSLTSVLSETKSQNRSLINLLLFYGANPQKTDGAITPLMTIFKHQILSNTPSIIVVDIMASLLFYDANPNQDNVLKIALVNQKIFQKNNQLAVALLLAYGADPKLEEVQHLDREHYPQLVIDYSPETEKGRLLKSILRQNQVSYGVLNHIPEELREEFKED